MKHIVKKWLAGILSVVMVFSLFPAGVMADEDSETSEKSTAEQVQALIDALPEAVSITADNRADVQAQIDAIDTAMAELTGDEATSLDTTRYDAAVAAISALDAQTVAPNPEPDLEPGAAEQVQALIDALPEVGSITAENRADVETQLAAIDAAVAGLTGDEAAALDTTRYDAAVAAISALDAQTVAPDPETGAAEQVQALIDALPEAGSITVENRADVEAQLAAIDAAKLELEDEELDGLDITRYMAAVEALSALNGMSGANEPAAIATDYNVGSSSVNISTDGEYTITGSTSSNTVTVTGGTVTITLNNVSVTSNGGCAFDIKGGNVTLVLADGTTNSFTSAGIYVADLFNHQTKKNMGELPKYYVHDCHPAIIDRVTFQKVQEEIARRAGKRKTSSRAKTELGKYSGKYALSEILICGECGSPYRRQTYMPKGEKIYVWRCLNRMENGKRICKNSPTFKEEALHRAIVAAMNEMFSQRAARDVLRESVATVLASTQPKMSLPAVKSKLAALEARYKELLDLVMADSAKYEDFEDEFRTTNEEMARLKSLQTKLELEQPSATDLDRRMEQISSAIDQMDASITDYDDIRTRQLISTIKVLDKETLLIRFKDGTEITQRIEK